MTVQFLTGQTKYRYGRQKNWRHADRPKKDLIFAPPHLKRGKKKQSYPQFFVTVLVPRFV
jgi:hypothetical protein